VVDVLINNIAVETIQPEKGPQSSELVIGWAHFQTSSFKLQVPCIQFYLECFGMLLMLTKVLTGVAQVSLAALREVIHWQFELHTGNF
jgi:hypothetical protein